VRTIRELTEDAFAQHIAGNRDAAAQMYDRLLGITDGRDGNVLYGYGLLAAQDEKHGLGAYLVQHALKIFPDHAPSWVNLGICLKNLGRDLPALDAYTEALRIDPESPEALNAISAYYVNRGMPEKVVEYAERGLKSAPEHPHLHNHMALGLLELGRYEEAWPHYEYRWRLPERIKDRRPYTCPRWNGERVGTLAIHGEQGIGDEILFMSVFGKVAERVGRVVIECEKRLVPMFERSFGVPCYAAHDELIAAEGEPDAYVPMASLFGIVGMPGGKPYMERASGRLFDRPIVGLAWRGGTSRTNKRERTLALSELKPLIKALPTATFLSVQYGKDTVLAEAQEFGLGNCHDASLENLAANIAGCDLVVTVCQTAVHLAGAMGVPCWVLTPKKCAWRYAGKSDRVPWYNSVRLFRQGDDEKWGPVVERMAAELPGFFA
jgi:tetratricopeptide (TPR) repeat protein